MCVPVTLRTVQESRDPDAPRSIDWAGTVLIALALAPLILAFSKGTDWGWVSAATLGSFAVSIVATVLFVVVERRAKAPLVHLHLLRNKVLVGATLAILIVAGTINALMYVLSLYFQNPAAFGMSAFEAGLATLPAAAGMIAVTPLIAPLAGRIGGGPAVALGFGLAAVGFGAIAFVESSWTYAAFVLPLVALAVGLGDRQRAGVVRLDGRGRRRRRSGKPRASRTWPAISAPRSRWRSWRRSSTPRPTATSRRARRTADALAAGVSSACVMMAIWAARGRPARPAARRPSADPAATRARPRRRRQRGLPHDPGPDRARTSDGMRRERSASAG